LAAIAILFGTSSIAGAKTFEHYDTPVLALLAPPISDDGSDTDGSWSSDSDLPHWLRLSLDGAPPKTGRPIRTTLVPPPAGSATPPAVSPVPSPDKAAAPELRPAVSAAAGAEMAVASPTALLELHRAQDARQIRVSLDHASLGALGHADSGAPRPIRLFLGGQSPSSSRSRPFRNALE
jgi:hypothetical protein